MPNWKNIDINTNLIKAETARSVLIAMPHSSDYDGWCFWHPAKLVREGRNSAAASIGYTDDFKFRLKKYGRGKWNSREVVGEMDVPASEIEAAFGIVDENIRAPEEKNPYETHKPAELEPEEAEVAEELKDD